MMAQRFALVHQRILKQVVFRPKHTTADGRQISSDSRHVTHSLCSIESLIGRKGCRFLLGMLVQVEEGKFYLEDFSAQVPLDIRDAEILTDGFLAENCIILVEGEMIDGTLYVHRMGNPIVETRLSAIQDIGLATTDMFQSISSLAQLEDIQQQETLHGSDGMLVVLSNVYLDNPQVMEKLKILFEGFLDMNPVYIFMGNFMSSGTSAKELLGYFEDLTRLICSMDGLAQKGRFIFLPGPRDPGLRGILPQPALPKYCTQSLRNKVTHATFATNPCRLRYFSKEIVLYRNDVVFQLQRSALVTPRESGSTVIQHTVKTLLDQGHLAPYPRPIYWQHDHVMRLYPLPDALIIGDSLDQYFENYAECDIINPGRFSHDFSFVVYRPIASIEKTKTKSEVEFSQIGN
jgi:DNA polymerase epsilon subunit 2